MATRQRPLWAHWFWTPPSWLPALNAVLTFTTPVFTDDAPGKTTTTAWSDVGKRYCVVPSPGYASTPAGLSSFGFIFTILMIPTLLPSPIGRGIRQSPTMGKLLTRTPSLDG